MTHYLSAPKNNQIKNCRRKKQGFHRFIWGEQLSSKKAAFFKKTAVFFKNDEGKLSDPRHKSATHLASEDLVSSFGDQKKTDPGSIGQRGHGRLLGDGWAQHRGLGGVKRAHLTRGERLHGFVKFEKRSWKLPKN